MYIGKIISVDTESRQAKVRIPQLNGGSDSSTRVADQLLPDYSSLVPLDNSHVGKMVLVDVSNKIIIGELWI